MRRRARAWRSVLVLATAGCLIWNCAGLLYASDLRIWPLYHWGDKDDHSDSHGNIHALQYLLQARGYTITADGVYGHTTERIVRQFQKSHALVPNGQTNKPTWEALVTRLKQGDHGPAVTAVQTKLREAGFAAAVNGRFDTKMTAFVKRFQSQNDCTADGAVGPETWYALLEEGEGAGD